MKYVKEKRQGYKLKLFIHKDKKISCEPILKIMCEKKVRLSEEMRNTQQTVERISGRWRENASETSEARAEGGKMRRE